MAGFERAAGNFASYGERYESIAMERRGEVLELRFHTEGGPLQWGPGQVHDEFEDAFQEISRDSSLRVVIMGGTGDVFSGPVGDTKTFPSFPGPRQWEAMRRGATLLLQGLLEIEATVVSYVNGPAMRHAEIPLLGDIVLAAPEASFRDSGHLPNRAVPGDGMHFVMPLLLGFNRARHFLLTGHTIAAEEALALGIVSEILPREQLLPRAREIAAGLLEQNPLALRYAKLLLMDPVRRRAREELGHGLALEGLGVIDETAAHAAERG